MAAPLNAQPVAPADTGNPVLDLLLTRRSTVAKDQAGPGPSDSDLDLILQAAIRVPDHGKLTPWRIQVLRSEGQAALGALWGALFAADHPEATEKQIAFERDRPSRTPILLAVTAKLAPHAKIPQWEMILSGGAVCQNILIAAEALGHAAQWLSEWPSYREEVVAHLGHDPATDKILGFIHLGSKQTAPWERARPERDAVISEWTGPV